MFSWDVTPPLAASLRDYFESEGWEVTIAVAEGPRRGTSPGCTAAPSDVEPSGPSHAGVVGSLGSRVLELEPQIRSSDRVCQAPA